MMTQLQPSDDAARQYAAAYLAHYSKKDLLGALNLYVGLLAAHPDSPEAAYSRTQMHNIVEDVVPAAELLTAEVAMATGRLEPSGTAARDATGSARSGD